MISKQPKIKKEKKSKRTMAGVVKKVIDQHTASIVVEKVSQHPLYKRLMKIKKTYIVHVREGTELSAGDSVVVEACRPLSKRKYLVVVSKPEKI